MKTEVVIKLQSLEDKSYSVNKVVKKIISEYTSELDNYMQFVRDIVSDSNNPPSDIELDDFTLNIPTLMYFVGTGQEELGIKEDMAKLIRLEIYNEEYDKADGTIGDKKATAELLSQDEQLVQIVYQRAYKQMKLKLDYANETLQSIKKVITRRTSEMDLTRMGRS